eukprot:818049-Pyramimonas_sp.AAC.1
MGLGLGFAGSRLGAIWRSWSRRRADQGPSGAVGERAEGSLGGRVGPSWGRGSHRPVAQGPSGGVGARCG